MTRETHTVSFSELDTIRQCRLKHQLAYVDRLKPPITSPALARGTLFHKILEWHYLNLIEPNSTASRPRSEEQVILRNTPYLSLYAAAELPDEERELVGWVYGGYRDHYESDSDWEILAVEFGLEEWLPLPSGRRSQFKLKGRIDLVIREKVGGGVWIVDHKTCKDLPKGKEIDLDDQMAIYMYLMRRAGHRIQGVIYNACRTTRLKTKAQPLEERFDRVYTSRTDVELKEIAREALEHFQDAYKRVAPVTPVFGDENDLLGVEYGGLPKGSLPPRSPNTDLCKWKCSFSEACLMSRKGVPIRPLLADMGFEHDFSRH